MELIRSTLAFVSIDRANLSKLCSTMDLSPPVTPSCYNSIPEKLSICSVEQANNIMKESVNRLRDIVSKEEPENIEIDEKEMLLPTFQ